MSNDVAAATRARFVTAFGVDPTGVWSAPGRVNLIGEHTDYNEGFVLPFAIDRRTRIAIRLRDDARIRIASALGGDVVETDLDSLDAGPDRWGAYPLGTVWGLGQVGADLTQVRGFDAYLTSDVPVGAGLSSSAAIECALAVGLDDLWETGLGRDALVTATHLAENQVVGAPTGILDQSASLLCSADAALLIDCRDRGHRTVPLGLDDAGLTVLVVDTNVPHAHAGGEYAARRTSCEHAAAILGLGSLRELTLADLDDVETRLGSASEETFRRVRHVVTENARVLACVDVLTDRGPAGIGDLLLASHASLRDDYEVSVPELDTAVRVAVDAGAVGARMTGGGFGGSVVALVPQAAVEPVAAVVTDAFAAHAFRPPTIFTVRPSAGARRDA